MSVPSAKENHSDQRAVPPPLSRRSWPLVDEPGKTAALFGIALAAAAVIWMVSGSWLLAALGPALVLAAAGSWLVPTTIEVNVNGISQQALGRRRRAPWRSIQAFTLHPSGVMIYPVRQPAAADLVRGWFIPWHGQRTQLLALFDYYLGPDWRRKP